MAQGNVGDVDLLFLFLSRPVVPHLTLHYLNVTSSSYPCRLHLPSWVGLPQIEARSRGLEAHGNVFRLVRRTPVFSLIVIIGIASFLEEKKRSTCRVLNLKLSSSPVAPTASHGQARAAPEALSFHKSLSLWTALSAPRVIVPVKFPTRLFVA